MHLLVSLNATGLTTSHINERGPNLATGFDCTATARIDESDGYLPGRAVT